MNWAVLLTRPADGGTWFGQVAERLFDEPACCGPTRKSTVGTVCRNATLSPQHPTERQPTSAPVAGASVCRWCIHAFSIALMASSFAENLRLIRYGFSFPPGLGSETRPLWACDPAFFPPPLFSAPVFQHFHMNRDQIWTRPSGICSGPMPPAARPWWHLRMLRKAFAISRWSRTPTSGFFW